MPLYYFDVGDGDALMEDLDGHELPDLAAAYLMARLAAVEAIHDNLRRGVIADPRHFRVRDGEGRTVLTMRFVDALRSE